MKTGMFRKLGALENGIIKGLPMVFWGVFAVCILVKSRLFLTPVSLMPAALIAVLILCSKFKQEKWTLWLTAIFIIAFSARLVFLKGWPITPLSDSADAYRFSAQLSAASVKRWHEVFAANPYYCEVWPMHVPYVIFQTVCMRVLGDSLFSIQIVNVFFSSLTCVFAAMCAEGLSGSRRAGILAGLLMAFNVTALFMSSFVVNQHIAACFFTASLYLIIKEPVKGRVLNYVFSGILLAASQLMRPEMYIVVIAVLCMFVHGIIAKRASGKQEVSKQYLAGAAAKFLCFLAAFFAVMNLANAALLQLRWVDNSIMDSKLLYKLMVGLNQETEGRFQDADYPLAADEEAVKAVLRERLAGPAATAKLMIKKLCFQFSSYNYWWLQADKGGAARQFVTRHMFEPLTQSYMFFTMLLFLAASVRAFQNTDRRLSLLYIILIGYLCAFALIEVQQRYSYITIPVVTVLASLFFRPGRAAGEEQAGLALQDAQVLQ